MTITQEDIDFARSGHDSIGQVRKYSGEPYWIHTEAVRDLAMNNCEDRSSNYLYKIGIVSGVHDTLEDINIYPYNLKGIVERYGVEIGTHVVELTDVYTSEKYPELNRATRKKLEANRLGGISRLSKIVKLADLINNCSDIAEHDKGFAIKYIKEKEYIMSFMENNDPFIINTKIWQLTLQTLFEAKSFLNIV